MADRQRIFLPVFLIWLAVCAVLIFVSRGQIASGIGFDPDDQLRLVQIRDWMAGQSWFDTVQHRIGAPTSQPMHWPRWIELPLMAVIMALKPIIGTAHSELAAMVIVPLITLLAAMWLVTKISLEIFDRKIALLSAALTATAVPVIAQLRPMRIDHHGWQIVLALFVLWTMFWPNRKKAGAFMGAALALWLSISLEGLPLSVAFIALLSWRWVMDGDEGVRLFWTLTSFLFSSLLFYLASQGSFTAAINYCDAISPAHLWACGGGAAVILPAIRFAPAKLLWRVAALGIAGIVAICILYLNAPQCVGSAFGQMDPLVRNYWYVNVREGLPIWDQPWKQSLTLLGGSVLMGLIALMFMMWRGTGALDRSKLFLLVYAYIWSLLMAVLVQRASATSAAFALPLMAWLVHQAFIAARGIKSTALRIIATSATVFLILPGPLAVSMINAASGDATEQTESTENKTQVCDSHDSIERLNALPKSTILAPFDFGPEILVVTPHSVLATSHHRNDAAMADQIRIFTSPPNEALKILKARNIGYIAACADETELKIYKQKHEAGLWAQISDDKAPDWLQPVYLRDSTLLLWRVKSKPLRNGM